MCSSIVVVVGGGDAIVSSLPAFHHGGVVSFPIQNSCVCVEVCGSVLCCAMLMWCGACVCVLFRFVCVCRRTDERTGLNGKGQAQTISFCFSLSIVIQCGAVDLLAKTSG